MASKMIGRATCPECGFQSAHVKESEKCLYRYCPECGSQHYAKSSRQRTDLMGKTRLTEAPSASATETPPAPPPAATPTATASGIDASPSPSEPSPPPRRRGLFS